MAAPLQARTAQHDLAVGCTACQSLRAHPSRGLQASCSSSLGTAGLSWATPWESPDPCAAAEELSAAAQLRQRDVPHTGLPPGCQSQCTSDSLRRPRPEQGTLPCLTWLLGLRLSIQKVAAVKPVLCACTRRWLTVLWPWRSWALSPVMEVRLQRNLAQCTKADNWQATRA